MIFSFCYDNAIVYGCIQTFSSSWVGSITEFMVQTVEIAKNKIKFFTKIFKVGPFLEGRSGKGKQDIYSSQPF